MFSLRDGIIYFTSSRPGSEATLGMRSGYLFPYRDDLSHFDDASRSYVWAFDMREQKTLKDGERLTLSTAGWKVVGDVIRSEIRSTESFSTRDGLILFSSNQPGTQMSLFDSGGTSLPFRGAESKFDDFARSYTWAFSREVGLIEGEWFILTISDRVAVAEVRGGKLTSILAQVLVTRGQDGSVGMCVLEGQAKANGKVVEPVPVAVAAQGAVSGDADDGDDEGDVSPLPFPVLPEKKQARTR